MILDQADEQGAGDLRVFDTITPAASLFVRAQPGRGRLTPPQDLLSHLPDPDCDAIVGPRIRLRENSNYLVPAALGEGEQVALLTLVRIHRC